MDPGLALTWPAVALALQMCEALSQVELCRMHARRERQSHPRRDDVAGNSGPATHPEEPRAMIRDRLGIRGLVAGAVARVGQSTPPVAAYALDETSGTTTADASVSQLPPFACSGQVGAGFCPIGLQRGFTAPTTRTTRASARVGKEDVP
jgi:hypothetical protein